MPPTKRPLSASPSGWRRDSEHIKDYLDLQFIIRFIERIGDHAKNIAQDTVYSESAQDIRHGGHLKTPEKGE